MAGRQGYCGLEAGAIVAESFTHIGEEPQINPSFVISLAGCALRCRYCQQSEILFQACQRSRVDLRIVERHGFPRRSHPFLCGRQSR